MPAATRQNICNQQPTPFGSRIPVQRADKTPAWSGHRLARAPRPIEAFFSLTGAPSVEKIRFVCMAATAKPLGTFERSRGAFALTVSLLMLSLALSVSTRFVRYYPVSHSTTSAQCDCSQQKRQDLEKYSLQWVPPALHVSILYLPVTRILPAIVVPRRSVVLVEFLYNRPPPAC